MPGIRTWPPCECPDNWKIDREFGGEIGEVRLMGQQNGRVRRWNLRDGLRQVSSGFECIVGPRDPQQLLVAFEGVRSVTQNHDAAIAQRCSDDVGTVQWS